MKKHLGEQVLCKMGFYLQESKDMIRRQSLASSNIVARKSLHVKREVANMLTKYDVTTLNRDSLPEEVLHELNEYEGMGRELVSIKVYDYPDGDDINEATWHLVFYEPFFSFESSEYDNFSFVDVCYQKWPTNAVHTYYHNIQRGEMVEALKHQSKRQKEVVA